jgi:hypothetical protein
VMLRPSKPTVGRCRRGLGVWCTETASRASAHNGPIGYARTGRKGPSEKQFVFSTARHACAICIYDIDKNYDIIEYFLQTQKIQSTTMISNNMHEDQCDIRSKKISVIKLTKNDLKLKSYKACRLNITTEYNMNHNYF